MNVKIPYVVVNGKIYIREDEVLDAIVDIAGFARVESSERYNNLLVDLIQIDCEEADRRKAEDAKKPSAVVPEPRPHTFRNNFKYDGSYMYYYLFLTVPVLVILLSLLTLV